MRIIAIIPARGGSKGIPRKNMVDFHGKPLIQWTIDAAVASSCITDIVVTSDSIEILEYVKKTPKIICIERPKELALDTTKTEPVIAHALAFIEQQYDYLIVLQPTSPLRTTAHITAAFATFIKSKATALISVCGVEHHPYKSFKVGVNGYLEGIINNEFPFFPRQSLPLIYRPNGAIYIVLVKEFLKNNLLFTNKTLHFIMSTSNSLDVDTLEDLK